MAEPNVSCLRQDGNYSLQNPQMSPERYNELSREYGFEWIDQPGRGRCGIDIEPDKRVEGLQAGEIRFLDAAWKQKYTTGQGKLNAMFQRRLRDVVSRGHNHIIYQVVVDRFENGNPDNDRPLHAYHPDDWWSRIMWHRMFDGTGRDLNRIQGGDIEGLTERLPYIAELGATRVWMSPLYENALGFAEGGGHYKTNYHGYWPRDFARLNPGILPWRRPEGEADQTRIFADFAAGRAELEQQTISQLSARAHGLGLGLILDVVLNHTNPVEGAEHGELYYNGELFCTPHHVSESGRKSALSAAECYHLNPDIRWNLANETPPDVFRHELWDWTLSGLADLRQDNLDVMQMLIDAHRRWVPHVDGLRIDTLKHVPPIYNGLFVTKMRELRPDLFVVGEWFDASPDEPQSLAYLRASQVSAPHTQLNFGMKWRIFDAFKDPVEKEKEEEAEWDPDGLVKLGALLAVDLGGLEREYVTFYNSHDWPRAYNYQDRIKPDGEGGVRQLTPVEFMARYQPRQEQALAVLFCAPGIPNYYYGDEFDLYDEEFRKGFFGDGGDPFNRPMMIFPEDYRQRRGFRLLQSLTSLRKKNPALRFGETRVYEFHHADTGAVDKDALAFERGAMGNRVLYMTLRGEKIFDRMANYTVDWPEGGYVDSITGIKYMVSGDEGRRRIGPVDGTYKHPSTGETVAVKDGKIEGASLHTVILTVDKLDGRIARLTSQEYDASIVR